jgi:hypothetical protein
MPVKEERKTLYFGKSTENLICAARSAIQKEMRHTMDTIGVGDKRKLD